MRRPSNAPSPASAIFAKARRLAAAVGMGYNVSCADHSRAGRSSLMTAAPNPEPRPPRSPFLARLAQPNVVVGDGAMGTMLYSRGVPANACFDECNLTQSRLVMDIHE